MRFPTTLASSSAVAGVLDPAARSACATRRGLLGRGPQGFGCDADRISEAAYSKDDVLGYLEVHIEQGPVLEIESLPLGVVTSIAGQSRFHVTVSGEAGHAGTVPMTMRRDALAAAAEMMLAIEDVARGYRDDHMVATVGRLSLEPGAVNVIPRRASFTLDIRAESDPPRAAAIAEIRRRFGEIAERRHTSFLMDRYHDTPTTPCAAGLQAAFAGAVEDLGLPVRRLTSGAGHDGHAMHVLTDIAMLFVRCRGRDQPQSERICRRDRHRARRRGADRCHRADRRAGRGVRFQKGDGEMKAFVEAAFAEEVAFLKAIVRVPSDNPARGLRSARGRRRGPSGSHGLQGGAPPGAGALRAPARHEERDQSDRPPRVRLGQGSGDRAQRPRRRGAAGRRLDRRSLRRRRAKRRDLRPRRGGVEVGLRDLRLRAEGADRVRPAARRHDRAAPHLRRGGGGFVGPKWLLEQGLSKPDLALSAGFSYAITTAHNGVLHLEVVVRGKQAHAAMPETASTRSRRLADPESHLRGARPARPPPCRRRKASARRR